MDIEETENGWQQVHAGASLVTWSRLARWDAQALGFAAVEQQDFESDHAGIHGTYGRLVCWLAFAVGAEYVCKGVCLLRGRSVYEQRRKRVIRPPSPGEDLESWVRLVNRGEDGARDVQQEDLRTKTLARVADEAWLIPELGGNRDRVVASMKFLASTIRNRDAHRYVKNVRSLHFSAVADLLVPSLNDLLAVLDRAEVAVRLARVTAR